MPGFFPTGQEMGVTTCQWLDLAGLYDFCVPIVVLTWFATGVMQSSVNLEFDWDGWELAMLVLKLG